MLLEIPTPPLPVDLDPTQDWPAQGDWTYDDYLRLPDDGNRYEIIYGVLYVQAAPGTDHQRIARRLIIALDNYVTANGLGEVFFAPYGVHLHSIAYPVQPDVMFVAADKVPHDADSALMVPPDIVIEILSPSTRRRDAIVKFDVYQKGGVREYWLVDPVGELVEIYALMTEEATAYELVGLFAAHKQAVIRSTVLPGLQLAVKSLFGE